MGQFIRQSSSMKSFACVIGLVALSSSAPQFFRGASLPLAVRGAGQTSSQSVSRPGQEVRSLVQSKAFGATHATTSQFDNSKGLQEIQPALGALRPVNVGLAAVRSPVVAHAAPLGYAARPLVAHAAPAYAARPVIAHAAPIVHAAPAYAARSVIAHAAPAYAAPVIHAAPAYAARPVIAHPAVVGSYADPLAEVSPYNFNYAVADDYSASNFQAGETSDGLGIKTGSYSAALPDGRTQTVNYSTNDYDGYVADVSYAGAAVYPDAPVVAAPVASPVYQG